ncbi:recombinase family protein [Neobacillus sp. M.A.Huq-85]
MIQTKENITKYKVFYRRANITNQNLEMQESADALYRENYSPSEILIMNENGVSANTTIENRPQMKKLYQMIMKDQIDLIYVYDRSRLFRDFYLFNDFLLLCKKHNVNIFYTSTGNGYQKETHSTLLDNLFIKDSKGKRNNGSNSKEQKQV